MAMPLGKRDGFKTRIRMEKCIRLEAQGLADADIALFLGLTPAGVATMKARPAYKILRQQLVTGIISEIDAKFSTNLDLQQQQLREMVPTALGALYDALMDKSDKKLRVAVAQDVLNREGRLAQIQKLEVTAPSFNAASQQDDEMANLLVQAVAVAGSVASPGQSKSSTGSTDVTTAKPETDSIQ